MKLLDRFKKSIKFTLRDFLIKQQTRCLPLKIIIGAGGVFQKNWIPTDVDHLNLLNSKDWDRYFRESSIDAISAEHVWEHLTREEACLAAQNCYKYLKCGGYLRVAVPDGFHPSPEYINAVRPGGSGAGSDDHKILYNYQTFSEVFKTAQFEVELVEYFDEKGRFHKKRWNKEAGLIRRSSEYDERNQNGILNYTSIILDAWKKKK